LRLSPAADRKKPGYPLQFPAPSGGGEFRFYPLRGSKTASLPFLSFCVLLRKIHALETAGLLPARPAPPLCPALPGLRGRHEMPRHVCRFRGSGIFAARKSRKITLCSAKIGKLKARGGVLRQEWDMEKKERPVIGISVGDPAGIGPEICLKALSLPRIYERCIPVLYADRQVLEDGLALTQKDFRLNVLDSPARAGGNPGIVDFIDPGVITGKDRYRYGQVGALSGEASFQYVLRAIRDAMAGLISAVVTGPINKEAVNLAGHHYAGHTEIFAEYTNTKDYAMLLSGGGLNVIHATTHVSLREACDLITRERVLNTIRLADQALRLMGKERRRIAVAGFNPHASENGLFGDQEERAIIPAVKEARAEGLDVTGPVPPDTVFVKALGGQADIVVAMYHDQGHIPLKLLGFRMDGATGLFSQMSGVNTTIGLPVIRSSVDHGTAYDRAGKNISNEQSLVEALDMAAAFVENRAALNPSALKTKGSRDGG
jgi:4-hydroxythreonine-4-phosphate dehydrogenase